MWSLPSLAATGVLLLLLFFTAHANAQDAIIPSNLDGQSAISAVSDTNDIVQVGQILTGVEVYHILSSAGAPDQFGNPTPDTTYSLWSIEPASAARIVQPGTGAPASNIVDVEFLEATTVTITATGFDQQEPRRDMVEPGFNDVVFTFTVVDATGAQQNISSVGSLNDNQRSAQSALAQACVAINANSSTGISDEQYDLLDTCEDIALEDQSINDLDRIAAEELFALGDALTISADQHISNIQSRINRVRAGQRDSFDVSSLKLTVHDQQISGPVLSMGKNALAQYAGGSASQDMISDSALGMFISGNISIGDIDGKGAQRNADISSTSVSVGADYRLDDQRVFGAALGLINDSTDFTGDNGDMDMQGFSLNAFGTWYDHDKGYVDVIAELSQNNFELQRRINLPGLNSEFANSSTDATRMALSINSGVTFQRGATEFGPVARIALTRASIDGFRENSSSSNGGSGTALDVKPHVLTSIRLSIGGEVKRVVSLSNAVLVPTARLELEMETETDKGSIEATFVNDPGKNAMSFTGAQRSPMAMFISVGSAAVFKNGQSAFFALEMRALDDHVSQNRVRLGYRMHF